MVGTKNTNFIFMFIMQKLRFQFVEFKNKNRDSQLTLLNDVKNFDKTLKIYLCSHSNSITMCPNHNGAAYTLNVKI